MTTTAPPRTVAGDSASSAVWTLASRITGFGRVVLVGAVLGPTFVGNLFQLANQLPWLVFEITVGSLLGSLIVPALMAHIGDANDGDEPDLDAIARLAGGFATTVAIGFGAVSLLVIALAPLLAELFALPVPDTIRDDLASAAVPLILLTAPQLVGYGLTVTGQSVQQAMGSYAFPAGAAMVENVVVIATLIAYGIVFETSTTVAGFDLPRILLLGGGSSLGVALHVAAQWWGVRRLGLRVRPSFGWRDPEVRDVLRRALAATSTAALNGVRILGVLIVANSISGGVVALQLGLNLVGVAVALGAKPVAYALLPRLAVFFRNGQLARYREAYARSVALAALIAVPAAIGAASFGWLLGPVLAVGDMNTTEGRQLLAVTVTAIAGAVIGEALHQLAVAGSYAKFDSRSPLIAFAIRLTITAGLVPVAFAFDGPARLFAIILAISAGDLISALLLHRLVDVQSDLASPHHESTAGYSLGRSVGRTAVASMLGFGTTALVAFAIVGGGAGRGLEALVFIGLAGVGAVTAILVRSRLDDELADLVSELRGATP